MREFFRNLLDNAGRGRADLELRRMQAQFEERVAARTEELTRLNQTLQSEISVRDRFEQALAGAREWFEVTLASIGDAVIVVDTEGRVTFINQIARNLTRRFDDVRGFPAERVFQIVDESTGAAVESPVARVLETAQIVATAGDVVLLSADGARRPVDNSAAPILNADGQVLGVVLVFRDVTARRAAEGALRKSEERYRALVQATAQIVWTTDPAGNVVADSPSWRAFTGQSYDEWKGWGWVDALHPDDRAHSADAWRRAVDSRTTYHVEYRLRAASGEYRDTEARAVPVLDREGTLVEWVGCNVDVTEQKQAAQALREADRRKDQFLAMLGHELRNPLSGISSAIQMLARIGDGRAEAGEMRQIIARQTGYMSQMIEDLLDVSRVSQGKIKIRPEPLDLANLLRNTADDMRAVFRDARLELHVDLPDDPVTVLADPTRLSQVFVNLLQNAAKFTNPGGCVFVTVAGDLAAHNAVAIVRDTGIGMSPATLQQVFTAFTQADSSLERSRGGLGLGLALVKGLVELHGGTVSAASAGIGHGAAMTVRLPLSDIEPPPAGEFSLAAHDARPLRILIIDDRRDASYPLRKLLEFDGHTVEVAVDGPSGIELALATRPDVVLCDIGLPGGMSGYNVAQALRADDRTRQARLIAVTGYGQEDDRRRAREAGFDNHLTKPVGLPELRSLLASALPAEKR